VASYLNNLTSREVTMKKGCHILSSNLLKRGVWFQLGSDTPAHDIAQSHNAALRLAKKSVCRQFAPPLRIFMTSIRDLPTELLTSVLELLPPRSLREAKKTCQTWKAAARYVAQRRPSLTSLDSFERRQGVGFGATAARSNRALLRASTSVMSDSVSLIVQDLRKDGRTISRPVQLTRGRSTSLRQPGVRFLELSDDMTKCLVRFQEMDEWYDNYPTCCDYVFNLQTGDVQKVAQGVDAEFSPALWTDLERGVSVTRTSEALKVSRRTKDGEVFYTIPTCPLPLWCALDDNLFVENEKGSIAVYSLATGMQIDILPRPPGKIAQKLNFVGEHLVAANTSFWYFCDTTRSWKECTRKQMNFVGDMLRHRPLLYPRQTMEHGQPQTMWQRKSVPTNAPSAPTPQSVTHEVARASFTQRTWSWSQRQLQHFSMYADAKLDPVKSASRRFVDEVRCTCATFYHNRILGKYAFQNHQRSEEELTWWFIEKFHSQAPSRQEIRSMRKRGEDAVSILYQDKRSIGRVSYAMLTEQGLFKQFPWVTPARAHDMLRQIEALKNANRHAIRRLNHYRL
jgi:hypothetical protein